MELTPKQERFVAEYLIDLNATQAAIRAGYSAKTAVVRYFEIQHWAQDQFGLMAMIGLIFACGLPGWALVRWTFNAIRKRDGKGIDEVLREIREGARHDA